MTKMGEKNQSHLEFHSIFNQDRLTNFSKKSAVSKGKKRVKLTLPPTEVLKTCSSATENVLNI